MSAAFESRRGRLLAALLAGVKLWLVAAQPLVAVGPSPHDDRLFLRLASALLDGRWLGAYGPLTLAKGPAYPVFIAGTVATGIPLPLAQHLLYLLACWLVVRALRPVLRNDWWAVGLFALLLWQPMSYEMSALGRVVRQHLYTPCTLLVFAGLAALYTRAAAPAWVRAAWAGLLGSAWGTLWLTREESIWIVPATVLLVAVAIASTWRVAGSPRRLAASLAIAVTAAALPVTVVCALNARFYGWWGTVEVRAPQFLAAYGALSRVQSGPPIAQVSVPRASRAAVYAVSPAFAELRPWLEGRMGRSYAQLSREMTGAELGELEISGWWIWALRDAVGAAGHSDSAAEGLAFYQRLADEVNAACDRGELPARPPRATLMPVWQPGYTAAVLRELPGLVGVVVAFSEFTAHPPPSIGNAKQLRLFRDLSQWFISPSADAAVFDTPTATAVRRHRVAALDVIGRVARWICVVLVGAGVIAWIGGAVLALRRRTLPAYTWWYATTCLGTMLAVVLITLLVNVTAFPHLSPAAFSQAYPLVLLFAIVAGVDFVAAWRRDPAPKPAR